MQSTYVSGENAVLSPEEFQRSKMCYHVADRVKKLR
jgi:hypothetical protein